MDWYNKIIYPKACIPKVAKVGHNIHSIPKRGKACINLLL